MYIVLFELFRKLDLLGKYVRKVQNTIQVENKLSSYANIERCLSQDRVFYPGYFNLCSEGILSELIITTGYIIRVTWEVILI